MHTRNVTRAEQSNVRAVERAWPAFKCPRYEKATLGMFDFSYAKTYKAACDSLKRLKLDCVDSMQVRCLTRFGIELVSKKRAM